MKQNNFILILAVVAILIVGILTSLILIQPNTQEKQQPSETGKPSLPEKQELEEPNVSQVESQQQQEEQLPAIQDENVTIYFIDVGQGDSILLDLPNNEFVLVDTGTSDKTDKVWNFLQEKNATHLTYLIGTHPDVDHIGGIKKLIEKGLVFDKYLGSYFYCGTKTCDEYRALVYPKRVKNFKPGDYLSLSIPVQILNPDINAYYGSENDNSVVLYLKVKNVRFLLTGDCSFDCEKGIRQKFNDIKAEILKVGHHGSNTSSSADFLSKVLPEIAVISVGANNNYGLPHPQALERLSQANAKIYRTDLSGTIIVTTNGINYAVLTEKAT